MCVTLSGLESGILTCACLIRLLALQCDLVLPSVLHQRLSLLQHITS